MELFFKEAARKNVGVIVRVPLASGLLTGTFHPKTVFSPDDHRTFNRDGAAFDKGETFSGINYETGLAAVEELKRLFPNATNLAPIALKWILAFDEVSCIIPGASRKAQVLSNLKAIDYPPLTEDQNTEIEQIYNRFIKPSVHQRW